MRSRKILGWSVASVIFASAGSASAAVNVWVDFNASWVTELNQATADAGIANFDATERATIESNIFSHLQTYYSGYQVNFSLTDPGGSRDRINYGYDEVGEPAGTLGFAPLQIGNFATGDDTNVIPRNFAFSISGGDDTGKTRAQRITEISLNLAGTGAHELGHSLGLQHHQAYGNPGITPANYANTGGLQNLHVIATGSTGLTEAGRETLRSFNRWERAMFDMTGGTAFGGDSIVNTPVTEVNEVGDIGSTIGTASPLVFQNGETSGMQLALRRGDIDAAGTDVDWYSFVVTGGQHHFSAEVFSTNLFLDSYDSRLRLLAADGTTTIASNDDVRFNGDTFNSGPLNSLDPFLLNIVLNPGTYYLAVEPVSGAQLGDDYELLAGLVPVPEPTSLALLMLSGAGLLARRRTR